MLKQVFMLKQVYEVGPRPRDYWPSFMALGIVSVQPELTLTEKFVAFMDERGIFSWHE